MVERLRMNQAVMEAACSDPERMRQYLDENDNFFTYFIDGAHEDLLIRIEFRSSGAIHLVFEPIT
jgi:hypothetical protein